MPINNQDHHVPKPTPKRQGPRRRSPKACLSCRARKVRCDVAFVSNACTNCVLDNKQCVVSWRRRHQHCRNKDVENSPQTETETETRSQSAAKDDEDSATALTEEYCGTPKLAETGPLRVSTHDHIQARTDITSAYYSVFCISNLSSLHPDDINHLESQGCFKIPETSCLDELLGAFFRYAHPILPVINEAEFWSAYDSSVTVDKTNRVPIVLLSAMLFVACNYVSDHVIQNMNFGTASEAGENFRRKTKLLYDQETESSPLILAQVSLLLTHWTPQKVWRQGTQWLSRAIHHAHDALSEVKLRSSPKKRFTQSNLRRVWGCCILSDRIHSLYTRRPLMIPLSQAYTESDHPILSRADLSYEIGRSRVTGVEAKQQFIEVQEQMSELCAILGRVLALVYPQSGITTCRKLPGRRDDEYEFRGCKKDLKEWYLRVSSLFPMSGKDSATYSKFGLDDGGDDGVSRDEPVKLLLSTMYLHHDTAMLALCHSEMIRLTTNPPPAFSTYRTQEHPSLQDKIGELSTCVLDITNRLSDCLQRQHLAKFPNSMILCTTLPILLHLLNTNALALPKVVSPSSNLSSFNGQGSSYPECVRKAMRCLRVHFQPELEYILRTVEAVNASLFQDLKDFREESFPMDHQKGALHPGERSGLRMGNWRELLYSRPKLYARLIDTLDSVISWGGPLARAEMPSMPTGRRERPRPGLHQQLRAEESAPLLSPLPSSASPRRNTMAQASPPLTTGDELVTHAEGCQANPAFLSPAELNRELDGFSLQQTASPESHLKESMSEMPSPLQSDFSWESWRQEMMSSGTTAPNQIDICDDAEGLTNDCRDTNNMLGDNQMYEMLGPMLGEDMSMLADDMSKGPELVLEDACMAV